MKFQRREHHYSLMSNMTFRHRLSLLLVLIITMNAIAWITASVCFRGNTVLLGTALLAYALGLRHALDADHIAAIDNMMRKLMNSGTRPVAIGLNFSLGHSTIVVIGSIVIAVTANDATHRFASMQVLRQAMTAVGSVWSIGFLFALAAANYRAARRLLPGYHGSLSSQEDELQVEHASTARGGLIDRLTAPLFRWASRSWHMYGVGFIFGLGFDTATEVGLLNISATQSFHGLSFLSVLLFPILFTVAMSTIDSADNLLMLGVYGNATGDEHRRKTYRLLTTGFSVLAAIGLGCVELLDMARAHLQSTNEFWAIISSASQRLPTLGVFIVGVFAALWALSLANRTRQQRVA